mgnify:FL=1
MDKLKIGKTILPDEQFATPAEWLDAIGAKPSYRNDGSSIAADVSVDEWIYYNKLVTKTPVLDQERWSEFVSHRKVHQELLARLVQQVRQGHQERVVVWEKALQFS